jgi:hypothetical protein
VEKIMKILKDEFYPNGTKGYCVVIEVEKDRKVDFLFPLSWVEDRFPDRKPLFQPKERDKKLLHEFLEKNLSMLKKLIEKIIVNGKVERRNIPEHLVTDEDFPG